MMPAPVYIGFLDHYRGRWQLVIVRERDGRPVVLRLGNESTKSHTEKAARDLHELTGFPNLGELTKKGFLPVAPAPAETSPEAIAGGPAMVPAVRGTLPCCGRSITIRVPLDPEQRRPVSDWLCTECWLIRPLLYPVNIEVEDTPPGVMPVTRVEYMTTLKAKISEALAGMEAGTEVSALEISKTVTGARWDTWSIEFMFEQGEVTGVRPIGTAPAKDWPGFWPTTVWAVDRDR